ncbi:MAG TPA: hypothetical protein VKK79_17255 [Candidatus Lokiarchaeia archaeon]|nr:hypothetical protein [Candidatus Lokiarchaeia archaeon]
MKYLPQRCCHTPAKKQGKSKASATDTKIDLSGKPLPMSNFDRCPTCGAALNSLKLQGAFCPKCGSPLTGCGDL